MVIAKAISSLEKVKLTDSADIFKPVKELKAAKGERVSFQIIVGNPEASGKQTAIVELAVRSKLTRFLKTAIVGNVPCEMPVYVDRCSGEYITTEPAILPDVLYPLKSRKRIFTNPYSLKAFWFTVELPCDIDAGKYPVNITFTDENDGSKAKVCVVIDVKNVTIGKSDLKFTQWFHCDCIADYFGVKMLSEKHWRLMESFIKTAAHTGINMLLTPVFTPPLDTAIGGERPTMQLVKIDKVGNVYSFDFSLLDRWITLCRKYGIEYFEISHLFTQWGVCACPKIVVCEDGIDKKLFGWHIKSDSELYKSFLSQFLPALSAHLKELGIDKNCYFHISDEPSAAPDKPDFENYLKAKNFINQFIGDYKIMDALSNVEFFDNGLIEYPVCATNHIKPFMERAPKERWCYYCCGQGERVANRFIAMPSYRNRVSGVQFYMNDQDGFLQWGYNFYYSKHSVYKIDPYRVTDGMHAFPSGDTFSVYPYENGAIESIRTVVFYQGLQDRLLLKALEKKIGKDAVKEFVRGIAGSDITFDDCLSADILIKIHDDALELLEKQ